MFESEYVCLKQADTERQTYEGEMIPMFQLVFASDTTSYTVQYKDDISKHKNGNKKL